jgi:hypothetical protein
MITEAIGAVAGSLITTVFSREDAKKQRELIAEIENLSLAQQRELMIRAQDVQGELAKQELILKYLAVQKNDEIIASMQAKKYTSYIVLGVGVLALATVVILVKNKQK